MTTKTKPKTAGAGTTVLAPQKERVFSINATESGVRIRYVDSAPQQEQEIRRVRAD
jgi:hypothetical protein